MTIFYCIWFEFFVVINFFLSLLHFKCSANLHILSMIFNKCTLVIEESVQVTFNESITQKEEIGPLFDDVGISTSYILSNTIKDQNPKDDNKDEKLKSDKEEHQHNEKEIKSSNLPSSLIVSKIVQLTIFWMISQKWWTRSKVR